MRHKKRIKKRPPELLRDKEENNASFYTTKVIMLDLQNQYMFILCVMVFHIISHHQITYKKERNLQISL